MSAPSGERYGCGPAARWLPRTLAVAVLLAGLLAVARIDPEAGVPGARTLRILLLVATVISAMAPYLTYPVRKFGWWVIGATVVSPFLLGLATLTSVLGALALASVSVAAVRLIFGSPEGLPPVGRLADTLDRVGVPTTDLAYLPDQPSTVGLATATGDDGRTLELPWLRYELL